MDGVIVAGVCQGQMWLLSDHLTHSATSYRHDLDTLGIRISTDSLQLPVDG